MTEQYNPKNPDRLLQVELPPPPPLELNIIPLQEGLSTLAKGDFQSKGFRTGRSGFRLREEGIIEAREGIFGGQFNIGGTILTINNVDDIQSSLDLVEAEGGGIVYLQNGLYILEEDIFVPSGVTLQGVSRDGVLIDCNGSYAVQIAGENVYSTGTVTINNGDTTVVGSGTTWLASMVGRHILLDGLWYEILARADNTHITITEYQGDDLSGSAYVLATTNFSAVIQNITVTGATGSGIIVEYAQEPQLNNIVVYGCGTGIEMDYVVFPKLEVTSAENGVNLNMNFVEGFSIDFSEFNFSTTGAGVIINDSRNATLFNSSINDNTADGINMTNCSKIAFISFDISGNGGQGVEMVSGCNDNQFTDGVIDGNTSDGIKLTASSDRNVLVAVSIKNNGGYGINIAASTCDNNQIIAPAFENNTSGNINDQGTSTTVLPESVTTFIAGHAITAGDAVYISDGSLSGKTLAETSADSNQYKIGVTGDAAGATIECEKFAQSVTFSTKVYIKKIIFNIGKGNNPTDDVEVALQADNSNKPSNSDIAVTAAVDVQSGANYTFTFSSIQTLSANTKYWFVIRRTGALNDTHYYLMNKGTAYSGGAGAKLNDSTTWTSDLVDGTFILYETLPSGYIGQAEADVAGIYPNFIGFAKATTAQDASTNVKASGKVEGLSGLTPGPYYLSNTAGQISTSPGSNTRKVGIALSATELLITNIW